MGNETSTEKKKYAPPVEIPPGAEVIGNYIVEQVLGKGSFAEVKLGRNLRTGEKVALKFVQKSNLSKGKRKIHLQREIRFMKLITHPHIAMLYDVIEQEDSYALIMEHAGGGELLDYIRHADKHRIHEREARRLFRQIVSALDYCHQNNLIHRDIKPENVLLDEHTDVKIIDFGFSREFTDDMQLDSFIGSPHYAAPELLQGIKYSGAEVDLWSLGILLYVMVCGKQPFKHPDMKVLYAKIIKGTYEFPDYITESVKDLISKILQTDPKKRLPMQGIKNHPWVLEGYDGPPDNYLEPRPLLTTLDKEVLDELLTYGFEEQEATKSLLANQSGPLLNFYHLLCERKRQALLEQNEGEWEKVESSAMIEEHPAGEPMVTRVETGEMVPVSAVEKNVRRQIFRRQSTQNEVMKRAPNKLAPMVE